MASRFIKTCLLLLSIFWSISAGAGNSSLTGHLKPLGSHTPGRGVTVIGKFSSPHVFYHEFVNQHQPIWMRNALNNINHFGLTNWTDEYLREDHDSVAVNVEIAKKENREKRSTTLTLRQFLNLYQKEDLYMVHSLRNSIEDLVLVPPSLTCGGFQNVIQDAVLWLGSGRTQSVLHFDSLDNLLCLFDGQKQLVLIDPEYKEAIEAAGFVHEGSYSLVDVEKVDLKKFPRFAETKWKAVNMRAGDCVYIPKGWYHQVTSSTKRHLAVNFWFSHLYWFNTTDCLTTSETALQKMRPIADIGFASSNEVLRARLLDKLHDKGVMIKHNFLSSLYSSTEARREKFFDAVDRYRDSALSWSELYSFDIDKAVLYFPDIFDLPGGSNSLPDDLVLYDPVPQPFPSGCDTHEEREEDGGDDDDDMEDKDNTNRGSSKNSKSTILQTDSNSSQRPEENFSKKKVSDNQGTDNIARYQEEDKVSKDSNKDTIQRKDEL